ncbi:MAG: aminotransferase class I/II-fold pyridoxal phosphate-dependent enzyme [Candidatus Omnitrophica bacterium]|nr:aminotransferase class I/II-fold pyridoxal phosphate-dependent enzyme [Candidatus Omnitrophota bacterium]MDD5351780.1 aminotransferase class I/II-fold pyridoxal phosphate-dependent enzyme [Candidatus Omnitrophota bacterium]MDD5550606.1 aminotransferase class I/II-fold pyridoxal phosphate-dependent enzyme [Candidatus Omnitrophota bacterium]
MKDIISKKVKDLAPSGIRAFFDLVLGMKDVISLGVGEPDFVTPWQIRESAIYSLEQGYTSYTSNKGLYKLRLYISRHLKNRFGLNYNPDDEILITVGVSEGLDLAVRSIINPGEEVIIPQPCYVAYGPVVSLAGGIPIYIDTKPSGFKLRPKDLDKKCTKKTKALCINYPCNPTGISYTKKELQELSKVILKHNLLVISDEVYDELTYDYNHTPLATLNSRMNERVIYLNGFSKAYAMTGWRLGYACGNKEIIAAMTKVHQYTMLCAPITSQMAACEALHSGSKSIEEMKREYSRRRDFVIKRLNELGLECIRPQGAFYVFPSIKKTGLSCLEFANKLLKQKKVAVVPGTAFTENGEGHIRISYASSLDQLKQAFERIGSFIKSK